MYLFRAVDSYRQTVDFYLSETRDREAAKIFLKKALANPDNRPPQVFARDCCFLGQLRRNVIEETFNARSDWEDCSSTITGRRSECGAVAPACGVLLVRIYLLGSSGFQADDGGALVVWRVFLPLWAVLGHNMLYITMGFVWLSFVDDRATDEEVSNCQGHGDGYQTEYPPRQTNCGLHDEICEASATSGWLGRK